MKDFMHPLDDLKMNCSIHNTNVVDFLKFDQGMNQEEIAENLKSLTPDLSNINQTAISRYKQSFSKYVGETKYLDTYLVKPEVQKAFLQLAGLYWNLFDIPKNLYPKVETEDTHILVDPEWQVFVQSEENQNDWYRFFVNKFDSSQLNDFKAILRYQQSVREFLLLLNRCCFEFSHIESEFEEDPQFVSLSIKWAKRLTQLQSWWDQILGQLKGSSYYPKVKDFYLQLYKVAFIQVIEKEEFKASGMRFSLNLRLEIENTTQQTIGLFRTLNFILKNQGLLDESIRLDCTKEDLEVILINPEQDLAIKSSSINIDELATDLDTSNWSDAEKELLHQVQSIKKLMSPGF